MENLYEISRERKQYRQLECEGALLVEFRCLDNSSLIHDVWSHHAHIVYITSGNKQWINTDGDITVNKGEAIFCKKGGYHVRSFYEEEFCALLFFFPEEFIRDTVLEYQEHLKMFNSSLLDFQMLKMNIDDNLKTFFDSSMMNLLQLKDPSNLLLKLKFKELILQILTSSANPKLAAYFMSTLKEDKVNLRKVMQDNLMANLTLEEYARLCSRSLSSFKRDFQEIFGMAPGRWLRENRLKMAKMRLLSTDENINDIAFHTGFETTSHFIRCFRKQFGLPPLQFRQQNCA
ncbi:helix-turn-helix domain-containing protein [Fulvivirga imtechensis]|uniref:helix-turn-helix domain-containing protein n=1 Tax=Fulvivirga imtechensis TaxID=881893 RepID=UPI0005914240|nr:AraC family transcriptional regulator [Fulvivirga imtechensis]